MATARCSDCTPPPASTTLAVSGASWRALAMFCDFRLRRYDTSTSQYSTRWRNAIRHWQIDLPAERPAIAQRDQLLRALQNLPVGIVGNHFQHRHLAIADLGQNRRHLRERHIPKADGDVLEHRA